MSDRYGARRLPWDNSRRRQIGGTAQGLHYHVNSQIPQQLDRHSGRSRRFSDSTGHSCGKHGLCLGSNTLTASRLPEHTITELSSLTALAATCSASMNDIDPALHPGRSVHCLCRKSYTAFCLRGLRPHRRNQCVSDVPGDNVDTAEAPPAWHATA